MKNTLLIITLLFSFNAADQPIVKGVKPVTSVGGLEGWGRNGVKIISEDYSNRDKNYHLKAIKASRYRC